MRTAQEIGRFLRRLRKEEKVTQAVIAQRCGVTQGIWSRLERGKYPWSLDLIQQVVEGIPINAITLLGLEDAMEALLRSERATLSVSPDLIQRLRSLVTDLQALEQQVQVYREEQPAGEA
jgi:transcriptional regulator with XRE-family HTH domain